MSEKTKHIALPAVVVFLMLGSAALAVLISGWISPPTAHAQYSQTITQTLLTNGTIPVGGVLVPNIGQAGHYYTVVSKNASGKTCNGFYEAQMFGTTSSLSTLATVALPQTTVYAEPFIGGGNNVIRNYYASGAFASLYIGFEEVDNVNCTYSIFYVGTISPGGPPITPSTSFITQTAVLQQTTGSLNTSGDNTIGAPFLADGMGLNYTFAVYGMQICNDTLGQTVTVKSGTSGMPYTYAQYPSMAAGECVFAPPGQIPIWNSLWPFYNSLITTANITTLVINLSASHLVTYSLWFKFE